MQKNGESTGSIRVAVNGASGLEAADFEISIVAPELELPSGLTVNATHRVNYDDVPASSATETVESLELRLDDQRATRKRLPNITSWQRRALSPTQHVWLGPDNNGQTDGQKACLPTSRASSRRCCTSAPVRSRSPSSIASRSSNLGGWDGGVVEISTDDGGSWADVGIVELLQRSTNALTSAPIGANRPAFVNRNPVWPNFARRHLTSAPPTRIDR